MDWIQIQGQHKNIVFFTLTIYFFYYSVHVYQ